MYILSSLNTNILPKLHEILDNERISFGLRKRESWEHIKYIEITEIYKTQSENLNYILNKLS